jgi:ADP-ribosylglycohydrolase
MQFSASLIIDILLEILNGSTLEAAIHREIESQRNPLMGHPYINWLADPDDRVIGPRLSTACYVEDSVPAVIYLALKYHTEPEKALIANTNLGGDNAARGSILGALLGAACGIEKFPRHWVDGLVVPPPPLN